MSDFDGANACFKWSLFTPDGEGGHLELITRNVLAASIENGAVVLVRKNGRDEIPLDWFQFASAQVVKDD